MSFCCGASMLGTMGSLQHKKTYIHQVPILYCPICQSVEVHPKIKDDYEILADYAQSDQAPEIYFDDYVDLKDMSEIFADCIDVEEMPMIGIIKSQIDQALDLLSVAKKLKDKEWERDLFHRLHVLSDRLKKHQRTQAQPKG
ncbi:hypothetical protein [Bacillus horti]|uniref:YgiT-type zinc finger protein n=1 Tax=Caldalkalibacillus horti TaxID=77523 RepID=A0ABT9VU89_9BACI|nr:hypothetical protein [Bacillus horti]MDQ0164450.1 hypothetical protein [Bacillus horti]